MQTKDGGELINVIRAVAQDAALLPAFLDDLLTPSEIEEIVRRWQIIKHLHRGVPQRKIAKELKVGVATVTRGSRALLQSNSGFVRVLKLCQKNPRICKV